MAVQPPSVMQSRFFPNGVKQNACGHAAMYWAIARAKFLGITPPPEPPAPPPPDFQNPNF